MEKKHLVKRKLKRFCFVAHDTLSGYLLSLSVLSFLSRHQMQKKKDTSKGWHLDTKSERMLSVYAVLTELWHLLSSLHRHLSGPYSCLTWSLTRSLTLKEEVLTAVVSGRAKKSGRGHSALSNDCWNVVVCEHVCFCVPVPVSVYASVCVFIRVYLLPCVLQLTVTKASRLACKRDSCADRRICFCRFCLWA